MSQSTIAAPKIVTHGAGTRAPAARARGFYARFHAQLMRLLAQLAVR